MHLAAALLAVAAVTLALRQWSGSANAAIVSTTYLLVVLVVAARSRLGVAVATSFAAMLALNFYFLPPIGTFTIADSQNWIALFAFLAVSLVASNLSAVARARAEEAVGRQNELARLFDLSRDVLMMTDSPDALSILARSIVRRFDLEWYNGDAATEPVQKSALAHFWFVTLHPFDDGNGRIARAIADMSLARSERSSFDAVGMRCWQGNGALAYNPADPTTRHNPGPFRRSP